MSDYIAGVFGLFDSTVKAVLDEPLLGAFLVFLLFLVVASLLMLLVACSGGRRRDWR